MDDFEQFLVNFAGEPDRQIITKMIEKAKLALTENLVDYEIKSILESLLGSPINLLRVIATNRSDTLWSKVFAEIFDFLAEVISNHAMFMDTYLSTLVKLCLVGSYTEATRRRALHCLSSVCRATTSGSHLGGVVTTLVELASRSSESASCRGAVFEALGNICLSHPEIIITEETYLNGVWRCCLTTLERDQSPTLAKGVIHCLEGIFKNFGSDLNTNEIVSMFRMLTKICDSNDSNQSACPGCFQHCLEKKLFQYCIYGKCMCAMLN